MRRDLQKLPRAVRTKIKKLYIEDGLTTKVLHERFGLSESTILKIVGKGNRHAPGEDTLDQAYWPGGRKYNGRTTS